MEILATVLLLVLTEEASGNIVGYQLSRVDGPVLIFIAPIKEIRAGRISVVVKLLSC
jgi:hypothetical protein